MSLHTAPLLVLSDPGVSGLSTAGNFMVMYFIWAVYRALTGLDVAALVMVNHLFRTVREGYHGDSKGTRLTLHRRKWCTLPGWVKLMCASTQPWVKRERNYLGIVYERPTCNSGSVTKTAYSSKECFPKFSLCVHQLSRVTDANLTQTLSTMTWQHEPSWILIREMDLRLNLLILSVVLKLCQSLQSLGDGLRTINVLKNLLHFLDGEVISLTSAKYSERFWKNIFFCSTCVAVFSTDMYGI